MVVTPCHNPLAGYGYGAFVFSRIHYALTSRIIDHSALQWYVRSQFGALQHFHSHLPLGLRSSWREFVRIECIVADLVLYSLHNLMALASIRFLCVIVFGELMRPGRAAIWKWKWKMVNEITAECCSILTSFARRECNNTKCWQIFAFIYWKLLPKGKYWSSSRWAGAKFWHRATSTKKNRNKRKSYFIKLLSPFVVIETYLLCFSFDKLDKLKSTCFGIRAWMLKL